MNQSIDETPTQSEDEMTVLRYRPGFWEVLRANWQLAFAALGLVFVPASGLGRVLPWWFNVLALGGAVAMLWILALTSSSDVIAGESSVEFRRLFGLLKGRTILVGEIQRIGLLKASKWLRPRMLIELQGAGRRSFFSLFLKKCRLRLPGDMVFQTQIVAELLAHQEDIPVTDDARKLLAGDIGVSWPQRSMALISAGIGALFLACLLIVSIRALSIPFLCFPLLAFTGILVSSAVCLERESKGRATIASLGISGAPIAAILYGAAAFYGWLEYMPLLYAAGLVLAVGGLVAALPSKLPARYIAMGEGVLLVVLVLGTWSVSLRHTIPVREVYLSPPPGRASFTASGNTAIVNCDTRESCTINFLDVRTFRARSALPLEGRGSWHLVPIDDDHVLCTEAEEGVRKWWLLSASGERQELFSREQLGWIYASSLSPDGRQLAFVSAWGKEDEEGRLPAKLTVFDLQTSQSSAIDAWIGPSRAHQSSLRWRSDGRIVWGTIFPDKAFMSSIGRFSLWSWAPGEREPRLEFKSKELWYEAAISPDCDMAIALVRVAKEKVRRLVCFPSGESIDLPDVHVGSSFPEANWSSDGRLVAVIPDDNPRAVAILRTETGKMSVVYECAFGQIEAVAISPTGNHLAVGVAGAGAGGFYISDLQTGDTRRLRPLVFSTTLMKYGLCGALTWSPSGDHLAVVAWVHPFREGLLHNASAVWLASPRHPTDK